MKLPRRSFLHLAAGAAAFPAASRIARAAPSHVAGELFKMLSTGHGEAAFSNGGGAVKNER